MSKWRMWINFIEIAFGTNDSNFKTKIFLEPAYIGPAFSYFLLFNLNHLFIELAKCQMLTGF